jgi:O-antigen ligase
MPHLARRLAVSISSPVDGFGRRLLGVLAVSVVLLPVALARMGPVALVPYILFWTMATPWLLVPQFGTLRSEWIGATFLLLTFASADFLDNVLGSEQSITLALVVLSGVYLAQRRRETLQVMREPGVILLAAFLIQAVLSGAEFGNDDLGQILQNRLSVLLALLTAAVLTRRPGGARLVPALLIVGGTVSVPILLREVLDPNLVLFTSLEAGADHRAGGMFAQPNNVGMALSYVVAFAYVAKMQLGLSRGAAALIFLTLTIGLLACASRAALGVVLALLVGMGWIALMRRLAKPPIVSGLLAAGLVCMVAPLVGQAAPRLQHRLEVLGFENVARLGEVVSAASGNTEDLVDDDAGRVWLMEQALVMITEHPLLGVGTGNFAVRGDLRSHNQFLEVLGENGLVGGVLYLAFVVALARAAWRSPSSLRGGAGLIILAWVIHHFDNHNMLEYRFMVLPIGYVCGIAVRRTEFRPDCATAPW